MGIKQYSTYYEDYTRRTFKECLNDEVVFYQEFDIKGNLTFLDYPQYKEWYRWSHNEFGDIVEYSDSRGHWETKVYNEEGMPIYHESNTSGVMLDIKNNIGTPNPLFKRGKVKDNWLP